MEFSNHEFFQMDVLLKQHMVIFLQGSHVRNFEGGNG